MKNWKRSNKGDPMVIHAYWQILNGLLSRILYMHTLNMYKNILITKQQKVSKMFFFYKMASPSSCDKGNTEIQIYATAVIFIKGDHWYKIIKRV